MTLGIRKAVPADAERLFPAWETAVEAARDFVSAANRLEIARLAREDYLPVADPDVVDGAGKRP